MSTHPPQIIGHRGAPMDEPENTLRSFHAALDQGADSLECDIRLTADGAVVIMHDATVDATTDGKGAVAALSLAAIGQLRAVRRNGLSLAEASADRPGVPTFAEFLDTFGQRGVPLHIEIKPEQTRERTFALIDAAARIVHDRHLTGEVIWSSFAAPGLAYLQEKYPETQRALLYPPSLTVGMLTGLFGMQRWLRQALALQCTAIHPFWQLVTPHFVQAAHHSHLAVNAWTVDDTKIAEKLAQTGVDGIITNATRRLRTFFDAPNIP